MGRARETGLGVGVALGMLLLGSASVEAGELPRPRLDAPASIGDEAREQVLPGRHGRSTRVQRIDSPAGATGLARSGSADPGTWVELPPPVLYPAVGLYDSTADRLIAC